MGALEAYLVTDHAAAIASGALDGGRIGGVRLVSVRHPLPPIGTYPVARFATRPLAEIPADHIKRWFWTPTSRRAAWCAGEVP